MCMQPGALQTGGSRSKIHHLAFETLLTSIIPDDADELGLISFLATLLEVDRKAIRRCIKRSRDTFGYHGFVSVMHLPREARSDSIIVGRLVAREFWHAMCRLDTRPGVLAPLLAPSMFPGAAPHPSLLPHSHVNPVLAPTFTPALAPGFTGRKVSIRMGPNHYIQHWRHVQYCTNLEMAALFFTSAEYSAYLEGGGRVQRGHLLLLSVQVYHAV